MQSDAEIIQRILQGDIEGYRDLIQRYQHMIYVFIYKMVNNRADAEDLTQEVFVKAYEKLSTFRGDSQFSSWLHTLARNKSIDFLRRRKFHDSDEQLAYVPSNTRDESPQESLMNKEQRREIEEAFALLSDSYREVIVLRCTHEYPFEKLLLFSASPSLQHASVTCALAKNSQNCYHARKGGSYMNCQAFRKAWLDDTDSDIFPI